MLFSIVVLAMFTTVTFGQDVLMTIAGKDVTVEEFERIYRKNNGTLNTNQQTPEEYAELFINFKLKVAEAEALGMDTTASFIKEFQKYKGQLAEPYLTDEETKEELMKEAYERMKYDVHASHILISMGTYPSPEDTLAAYQKAMEIRRRVINGEDFGTVARGTSDDPSAKTNSGDLGYFTVFQMLYAFESAAFNMEPGDVSMPIRTSYGYHIIKLLDKRPAIGQIKVAHIFIRSPEAYTAEEAAAAKKKMMLVNDSLKNGVEFEVLAKNNSEDNYSAKFGGEIPFFGVGRMFPQFENAAFSLKNPGDISEPLQSQYGWHMIKLIEKKPIGTYEEMKSDLQSKAVRGDRGKVKSERYVNKLKHEYDFQLNESAYEYLIERMDTSVFNGNWDPYNNQARFDEALFTIKNGKSTVGDFFKYIYNGQRKRNPMPIPNYIENRYREFVEYFLIDTEKENLPVKFPEYRYILQEYHDGILLFDLMDKKVWTQAIQDTIGLENYYAQNRDNYMWGDRVEAVIVSCDSTVDMSAVEKAAKKISKGKWDQDELNKKFCRADSIICITLKDLKIEKGVNEHVDALNQTKGIGEIYNENGRKQFVIVKKVLPPMHKELDETRGQVTSDYQDQLEVLWLEELRNKYEIKVNKELLSRIKQ